MREVKEEWKPVFQTGADLYPHSTAIRPYPELAEIVWNGMEWNGMDWIWGTENLWISVARRWGDRSISGSHLQQREHPGK